MIMKVFIHELTAEGLALACDLYESELDTTALDSHLLMLPASKLGGLRKDDIIEEIERQGWGLLEEPPEYRLDDGLKMLLGILEDAGGSEGRTLPDRREVHALVRQLYWRFKDTQLPCGDFAEFVLISLHERGALAQGLDPDGMPHARKWPRDEA